MNCKMKGIPAAVILALAAASSQAALERVGPVDRSPTVGGFPAWFQDRSGVAVEFCDLKTQAEWDGGWCVIAPPDGPEGGLPEVFPTNFFDEHFYYAADNVINDANNGFRARLVLALESAFAVGPPIEGDQVVFSRHRLDIRNLPFNGDYRVITPFMDVTYYDQAAGDRIFETIDIGIGCPTTFECALDGTLGPLLLPSPVAGGPEVPPMPDLIGAPRGTDPFFDALGGGTASPGTGKKYLADPARVGPVTGSPLGTFTAHNTDGTATEGRNHNTFRIEVRSASADHNGPVVYVVDGETNFTVNGRLMTDTLPGKLSSGRAVYKADSAGLVTDIDVFASASPTVQARIPGSPPPAPVKPVLSFWTQPCAGALGVDAATGATVVNPPPYGAPSGIPVPMESDQGASDYWGQTTAAAGTPPASHVCIVDNTARNAAGQVVPAYLLRPLTDEIRIPKASYNGPGGGVLEVNAISSDPTAILTLAGFGPGTNGIAAGRGAGSGLELVSNVARVDGLRSPPAQVHVVSSRGGSGLRRTETAHGTAVLTGQPSAGNDSMSMNEDCSTLAVSSCTTPPPRLDLLLNDTVVINGNVEKLRDVITKNLGSVTVTMTQAPRMGTASISADGWLSYTPNSNANGMDAVTYTVTVDGGTPSNPAIVSIEIKSVNDKPVAGNTTTIAVLNRPASMNLIATSSDPDGVADVRTASIVTWPMQLGPKPSPVNGVVNFTPIASGTFQFTYRAVDQAGALSANAGTGRVTVSGAEAITLTRARYVRIGGRWRVEGSDSVRANQTLTIAYRNGTFARGTYQGRTCDGTATIPDCVIGTAVVDALGAWVLDQSFGSGGPKDPANTDGTWSAPPSLVRAFSSNPVLGGSGQLAIEFK